MSEDSDDDDLAKPDALRTVTAMQPKHTQVQQ